MKMVVKLGFTRVELGFDGVWGYSRERLYDGQSCLALFWRMG